MKNVMSVHDKAIRLLEGGIVEIDGDNFRLNRIPYELDIDDCCECELDSICREEHKEVCSECGDISGYRCYLKLAH